MLNDLDSSLAALLAPRLPANTTISFDPPDGQFAPKLPAADFFLYDVRENHDLAETQPAVNRTRPGRAVRRPAPVRVDCGYLVTAWASTAADEHLLLGTIARVLLGHPTLPVDVLRGMLRDQPYAPPTAVLTPSLLQSAGEFWSAMGGRPKAALGYSVTLAIDVSAPAEVPTVSEPVTRIEQIT